MIENRGESLLPEFTPRDRALFDALDRAEGMCINKIANAAHFTTVLFQDFSQARPEYRPRDYNFHFRVEASSETEPIQGTYSTHDEAAGVLVTALLCLSGVRNDLLASIRSNEKHSNIKIISDLDELRKFANSYNEIGECAQNGIALARDRLFSALVPSDVCIPSRSVLEREDGSEILLQTYPTAIDGVWWRVYTEGDKMDEIVRVGRG